MTAAESAVSFSCFAVNFDFCEFIFDKREGEKRGTSINFSWFLEFVLVEFIVGKCQYLHVRKTTLHHFWLPPRPPKSHVQPYDRVVVVALVVGLVGTFAIGRWA